MKQPLQIRSCEENQPKVRTEMRGHGFLQENVYGLATFNLNTQTQIRDALCARYLTAYCN